MQWAPFPDNPQLCFTKWDTVSAECLHFAPLLPQRNSSYGHPGFSQKRGVWAKPGRNPVFLGALGATAWSLLRITRILELVVMVAQPCEYT